MATNSYVYRQGTTAQTSSVVSTRFKIYTPVVNIGKFTRMGVTSSFGISESKNIDTVRGLGYGDQVAELVPGVTQPMSLSVTRTALYLGNLMQQFGYKAGVSGLVRSLKHHKWPFDIKTEIVFSELASTDSNLDEATQASVAAEGGLNNYGNNIPLYCVATVYEGCWMESYNTTYNIDQTAVTEDCTILVTDVFDISGSVYGDFIDSGNAPSDVTGASLIFSENNANV